MKKAVLDVSGGLARLKDLEEATYTIIPTMTRSLRSLRVNMGSCRDVDSSTQYSHPTKPIQLMPARKSVEIITALPHENRAPLCSRAKPKSTDAASRRNTPRLSALLRDAFENFPRIRDVKFTFVEEGEEGRHHATRLIAMTPAGALILYLVFYSYGEKWLFNS